MDKMISKFFSEPFGFLRERPLSDLFSFGGSSEDFKGQVQSIQEQYPECRVESEDMEFDNGYFRKVKIKCEEE